MTSPARALERHLFATQGTPQAPDKPEEQYQGEVCVANIGPKERQRRLTFGVITLALGIGIALILLATHVNPLWRLLLFATFYVGATGLFQWKEKT